MSTKRFRRVTRRRFLKDAGLTLAAAGTAPVLSKPFVSRAFAQTDADDRAMGHFVPEFDTWFDKFAHDWGEKNNIA